MIKLAKRMLHTCLAILVLASCAAAPVSPVFTQSQLPSSAPPTRMALETPPPVIEGTDTPATQLENRSSSLAPAGVDLDVTFITLDPMYYMYCFVRILRIDEFNES